MSWRREIRPERRFTSRAEAEAFFRGLPLLAQPRRPWWRRPWVWWVAALVAPFLWDAALPSYAGAFEWFGWGVLLGLALRTLIRPRRWRRGDLRPE